MGEAINDREIATAYFKSLNEARLLDAREAIRAALLINGGAASAVLAFSAQLVSKGCSPRTGYSLEIAMGCFALGVASAAATACIAYLTNHAYAEGALSNLRGESTFDWTTGSQWQAIGTAAVIASIAFFVAGSISAATAL